MSTPLASRSRPQRPIAITVCLITMAAYQAHATILARKDTTCPVCTHTFEAVVLATVDSSAGVDRDLFARSAGPQPVFYRINTCPKCYYSGYLDDDFRADIKFPKGFRRRVLKSPKLHARLEITPDTDQRMIPASLKYELAETCYRWRNMSAESMAWLCLRASWVARDAGSIMPRTDRLQRVMGFVERWLPPDRPGTNQSDRELALTTHIAAELAEGRFSQYQRPYVRYVLAMLLRRHGENAPFELLGPSGDQATALPDLLRSQLARTRESVQAERAWQRKALEHFVQAIDNKEVAPQNRPAALYLVAELYRRLGRANRARRYYDEAISDPRIDDHLGRWARQQRDMLAPPASH